MVAGCGVVGQRGGCSRGWAIPYSGDGGGGGDGGGFSPTAEMEEVEMVGGSHLQQASLLCICHCADRGSVANGDVASS